MDITRRGKIARLSKTVREELNRRLADGQPEAQILPWLNGLPEVQTLVKEVFGGKVVRKQNLYQWRRGGYQDWLRQQATLEAVKGLSADGKELLKGPGQALIERLGTWMAARYAVAARSATQVNGEMEWKLLREMCSDVVALRRSEHSAKRLMIEEERLGMEREKSEEEIEEYFRRWAEQPDVREWMCRRYENAEEKERRFREIMGLEPEEGEAEEGGPEGKTS